MSNDNNGHQKQNIYKFLLKELLKAKTWVLLVVDPNSKISFCSETIELIIGYKGKELIGKNFTDLFLMAPQACTDKNFLVNKEFQMGQIPGKKGEAICVDIQVNELSNGEGRFILIRKATDTEDEETKMIRLINDAKEQEKHFFAGELHDNISQLVTATR